jgi:hypothetical protein
MGATSTPIRLGKQQWVVLSLGLSLMITLAWCSLGNPAYNDYECEHIYLPSVEKRFGFVGGRTRLPDEEWRPYTLVEVDPEGLLGRLGFRSGDVPVAHHGGLPTFCDAIRRSEEGRTAFEVAVVNIAEWSSYSPRRIVIPPLAPGSASPEAGRRTKR